MPPSSQAAWQSLQNFQNSELSPDQALTQGANKYGVTGLQGQLDSLRTITGNLQSSIKAVDPSVTGRTAGSLVTEAQRNAIVNNERSPLVDQFNTASGHLSDVGHQFDEAQGLASNYSNSLLQGQAQKYQDLFGQYSALKSAEQQAADNAFRDQQLAEQRRASQAAANPGLSLASLLGGGAQGAAPQPSVMDHFNADLQHYLPSDYATRYNDGYTERTLIPKLASLYPELGGTANVAKLVYAYRKQYEH